MKNVYLIALMAVGTMGAFAQSAITPKKIDGSTMQNAYFQKQLSSEKVNGSFYLDYEAYDDNVAGSSQGVNFTNLTFNARTVVGDTGTIHVAAVVYDSLILMDDLANINYMSKNDVAAMSIDSLFFIFLHENNSGTDDTIITRILDVAANGTPGTNVYWADTQITNTSLSPGAFAVLTLTPGFQLPAGVGNFAVDVTFYGAIADTFRLRVAYPTDGNACSGTSLDNVILSEVYPSSFYKIGLGPTPSATLPRLDNGTLAYYYWLDCDGDNQVPQNGNVYDGVENPIQNWSVWTSVTVAENVSTDIIESNGVKLGQNSPNPAGDYTQIAYELKNSSDVRFVVTDLTGKVVTSLALGSQGSGTHTVTLNTADLNAGIYLYTMEADGQKLTRRMVVTK